MDFALGCQIMPYFDHVVAQPGSHQSIALQLHTKLCMNDMFFLQLGRMPCSRMSVRYIVISGVLQCGVCLTSSSSLFSCNFQLSTNKTNWSPLPRANLYRRADWQIHGFDRQRHIPPGSCQAEWNPGIRGIPYRVFCVGLSYWQRIQCKVSRQCWLVRQVPLLKSANKFVALICLTCSFAGPWRISLAWRFLSPWRPGWASLT